MLGLSDLLRMFVFAVGFAFSFYIVSLLVRKKISERHTLIWLIFVIVVVSLSIDPYILDLLARRIGVDYPPTLLFLVSMLLLMLVVLYQSIQISTLNEKVKELGQNMALAPYLNTASAEVAASIESRIRNVDGELDGSHG